MYNIKNIFYLSYTDYIVKLEEVLVKLLFFNNIVLS